MFVFLFVATIIGASAAATTFPNSHLYSRTPSGYVLTHCMHTVDDGTHLAHHPAGGLLATIGAVSRLIPPCNNTLHGAFMPTLLPSAGINALPADYDGWLQYSAFNLSSDATFDSFLGYFSVPAIPAKTPDQLFIFTGLQNKDWIPKHDPESEGAGFDIIQPVLQFPGDNGNYWSVKSWYVTLDVGTVASEERKCTPGDAIFGNMTKTGPTSWFVNSVVNGTNLQTAITVDHPRLATQMWAYNTLEGYGLQGCGTYPAGPPPSNSIQFTQLLLTTAGAPVVPAWTANPKPNADLKCKESTTIADPQTVSIFFGTSN